MRGLQRGVIKTIIINTHRVDVGFASESTAGQWMSVLGRVIGRD